jgi:hypothetical protein
MNIRVFMVLIPKRYMFGIGAARTNSLTILCVPLRARGAPISGAFEDRRTTVLKTGILRSSVSPLIRCVRRNPRYQVCYWGWRDLKDFLRGLILC